jgi:hypothetical protein
MAVAAHHFRGSTKVYAYPMTKTPSAGDILVTKILADIDSQGLRPDARESELLERARAAADRIAEVEAIVKVEGATFTDKNGIVRPSPLLAEIRLQTSVLARVLSGVQMSAASESKNVAKQRAGRASWAAQVAREDLAGRDQAG